MPLVLPLLLLQMPLLFAGETWLCPLRQPASRPLPHSDGVRAFVAAYDTRIQKRGQIGAYTPIQIAEKNKYIMRKPRESSNLLPVRPSASGSSSVTELLLRCVSRHFR